MWTGFVKDKDLKMKVCFILLCFVLAAQNVRAEENESSLFINNSQELGLNNSHHDQTENPVHQHAAEAGESTNPNDGEHNNEDVIDPTETLPIQNHTTSTDQFSTVQFSANLYEKVKKSQPGNFILSPLSLRNALAMLSLGAAGETAREIQESLKFPQDVRNLISNQSQLLSNLNDISSENSGVEFVTADKIYVNSKLQIKQEYERDVERLGGEIEHVNFGNGEAAAGEINGWVQRKTEGKIEKLVEPSDLNSQTSLLVLNTIYFKGLWNSTFEKAHTKSRPFFINASCSVNAEMMYQQNEFQNAELEDANAQVILLPYQGGRLSMMIYLPKEKEESSLDILENWLKNKSPFDIQQEHLNQEELSKTSVFLPKFQIRSSLELKKPLEDLGLAQMFDISSANFTNLFEGRSFFVSKVSQETFIEVNEEGTEAAAATGSQVSATSVSPDFKADRPFLFQIVDSQTKTVLFSGRVKNPLDSTDSSLVNCPIVPVETTTALNVDQEESVWPYRNGHHEEEIPPTPAPEPPATKSDMDALLKELTGTLNSRIDDLEGRIESVEPPATKADMAELLSGFVGHVNRTVENLESRMVKFEEQMQKSETSKETETTTIQPETTAEPSTPPTGAWGYTQTGVGMTSWRFTVTSPASCGDLIGVTSSVYLFPSPTETCVMLYGQEGCHGDGFRLDHTNWHLGWDIRKLFPSFYHPGIYTSPKSIGPCVQSV